MLARAESIAVVVLVTVVVVITVVPTDQVDFIFPPRRDPKWRRQSKTLWVKRDSLSHLVARESSRGRVDKGTSKSLEAREQKK